jgi:hypothetical protein
MRIPVDWLERYLDTEDRWWIFLLLNRIGFSFNFMGPPDNKKSQWYIGLSFYWFAIFFSWNYLNGVWMGDGYARFTGLSIYWGTKFHLEPGQLFWNNIKRIGRC